LKNYYYEKKLPVFDFAGTLAEDKIKIGGLIYKKFCDLLNISESSRISCKIFFKSFSDITAFSEILKNHANDKDTIYKGNLVKKEFVDEFSNAVLKYFTNNSENNRKTKLKTIFDIDSILQEIFKIRVKHSKEVLDENPGKFWLSRPGEIVFKNYLYKKVYIITNNYTEDMS
jgi:hypothetical protein